MRTLGFLSGAPRTSTKIVASLTGGRQHILGTISGFEANGWSVEPYIVGDKVPEHWLRAQHEMNKGKPFIVRLFADFLRILISLRHIRLALREIPAPNWVYERYAAYQMLGYFFQRRGTPWILETNDALYRQATSDLKHVAMAPLVRWMEKLAYRTCDVLVVISDDLKKILVQDLRIPDEKIVVVPNAADTKMFNPETVAPCRLFEDDTFVVGWQGAMYKWAGLEYLIRAIAILRAQGFNVGAVFVGDGHERTNLEALASDLGVLEHAVFVGRVPREQVPSYIAGFDVCYSGQVNWNDNPMYLSPLKLYDYMAMAKPVIASRFADAVSLTRDGAIGFLYEPESLEDLIEALQRAYDSRATLTEIGQAARGEILVNHTWERRMADLINTVDDLLLTKSHVNGRASRKNGRAVAKAGLP